MSGIRQKADVHAGAGNVGKADGAAETLIPGGIVVLETNLEFDTLDELPLLLLGAGKNGTDGRAERIAVDLTANMGKNMNSSKSSRQNHPSQNHQEHHL
mmetsp:Transcript_46746/g.120487  ORF Transcript_46746/g.120487 Transcript_46746/m.120487 type:complete len:99 (-) Transcript_46746:102-398(-)